MKPITIAMASDHTYLAPMQTTIKSVMYHNQNVRFYIINTDIPQEWFYNLQRYLEPLHSSIIDKKIDAHSFDNFAAPGAYVSYMAYGRLLIPQLIPDDKVLYLDSDTIVAGNLRKLFQTDLQGHYVAAVRDCVIDGFNSGVMLINNAKLKQNNDKIKHLFAAGQNQSNQQADQSALNAIFGEDYLSLDDRYNYMIGSERDLFYHPDQAGDFFDRLKQIQSPVIYHFTSADKPWNLVTGGTTRDIWWQYYDLPWTSIVARNPLPNVRKPSKGQFFTFTRTTNLQNFEQLVQAMPDFDFNVASWVNMAPELMHLIEYPNVHLFPLVSGPNVDKLERQALAYLDINDDKEAQMVQKANDLHTPIFTFQRFALNEGYQRYHIFADDDTDGMVHALRKLASQKDY